MKRFLFDTVDFDEAENMADTPVFSAAAVDAARDEGRKDGYAQGHAEAMKAAREALDEKLRLVLETLAIGLGQLTVNEERRETEKCIDAARLALHMTHKLMPQLAQNHGLPEIERIIASAIEARRDEPRIAITVPTALLAPLSERIDQIARDRGFAGKLIVIASDTHGPSDCRVEWADGGNERLVSRLIVQLENEFSRAIAGMQGLLAPASDDATRPTSQTEET